MGVTQYTGARYVPLFAEPAEWNNTRTYEPLTIVIHEGNSYTSKQYVPKGIDIANEKFWALTGNYNAQVEQYRKDVLAFDDRITTNKDNINAEVTNRTNADKTLQDNINAEVTNRTNADKTLQDNINAEIARAKSAEEVNATAIAKKQTTISFRTQNLVIVGDSWTDGYTEGTGTGYVQELIDMGVFKSVKKYAVGGTGWIAGDYKYLAQTRQIISDYADKPEELNIVMYVGSVNDLGSSSDAISNAAKQCYKELRAAFPNVQMYAVGNITNSHSYSDMKKMEAPVTAIAAYGGIPLYWPMRMIMARYDLFTSDGYHIKHELAVYYAHNIVNNMLGFFTYKPWPNQYIHFSDGDITFNDTAKNSGYDTIFSCRTFDNEWTTISVTNIHFTAPYTDSKLLNVNKKLLLLYPTTYGTFNIPLHSNFPHQATSYASDVFTTVSTIDSDTGNISNPVKNMTWAGEYNLGNFSLRMNLITQQYDTFPILKS